MEPDQPPEMRLGGSPPMLGCEDLELSSVGHPAEASALSLVLPRPAVLSTEAIGFLPVASSMRRKGRSTSVPPALSREHSRPTTDSNRSPKTKEPRLSEEWRSPADNWLIDEGEGTDPTQGLLRHNPMKNAHLSMRIPGSCAGRVRTETDQSPCRPRPGPSPSPPISGTWRFRPCSV